MCDEVIFVVCVCKLQYKLLFRLHYFKVSVSLTASEQETMSPLGTTLLCFSDGIHITQTVRTPVALVLALSPNGRIFRRGHAWSGQHHQEFTSQFDTEKRRK